MRARHKLALDLRTEQLCPSQTPSILITTKGKARLVEEYIIF